MQITCPSCGNACEIDGEISVGQHLLCPFCSHKFSYSGIEQDDVPFSHGTQVEESIQGGIVVKCPFCGTDYEMDKSIEGVTCYCNVCNKDFIAQKVQLTETSEQRTSTSVDRLNTLGSTRAGHLGTRTKVGSKMLMILCVLVVTGILGVVIFTVATKHSAEVKNGSDEAKDGSAETHKDRH